MPEQQRPRVTEWNQCKIDAAVDLFVQLHGHKGEDKFRSVLTEEMTKHPNFRVTDMADLAWNRAVTQPDYRRLPSGGVADVNFSEYVEFKNRLPNVIESCHAKRGR